jgi:hypothetical protein
MAHVFLSLGRISQVQAIVSAAASGLDRQPDTPEVLSLRGAFRLVLATAAARDNERTQAYAYLDQARAMRRQIGEALRVPDDRRAADPGADPIPSGCPGSGT